MLGSAVVENKPSQKELLVEVFGKLQSVLGEPSKQPLDLDQPMHISAAFDGRHASGFGRLAIIRPESVDLTDKKYMNGRQGYLDQPAMDVSTERPYRPGDPKVDFRLQPNPNIHTENADTVYVVLSGNYTKKDDADKAVVVTRSWALRNDGLTDTWETWRKWEDSGGMGGNTTFSKQVEDGRNNLDLWSKVLTAVEATKQS